MFLRHRLENTHGAKTEDLYSDIMIAIRVSNFMYLICLVVIKNVTSRSETIDRNPGSLPITRWPIES
jgi:hypothetical protein